MKPVVAVIVLYRMSIAESPTYRTLQAAFALAPQLASYFDFVIMDNSPEAQDIPSGFTGEYIHDGRNPGLAERYNFALARAIAKSSPWLLTLDQDTTITLDYLLELVQLAGSLLQTPRVGLAVPKLIWEGRVYSPRPPRFRRSRYHVSLSSYGVLGPGLQAFNSAALVRTEALQAAGGYPEAYWLDFLDHATFALFENLGWETFVMRSVLEHDMSLAAPETMSSARVENILQAEQRFYLEFGSREVLFRRRFDLLRQAVAHGRRGRFRDAARRLRFLFARS